MDYNRISHHIQLNQLPRTQEVGYFVWLIVERNHSAGPETEKWIMAKLLLAILVATLGEEIG